MSASTSRVFSSVTLASGVVRMIGAMAWPGETPSVSVTRYDGGRRIGRTAFYVGPAVDALVEALRRAGESRFSGREVVALLPHGRELELEISVERSHSRGAVVTFVRVRRHDRERVGNATVISGSERSSLGHACRWAREAAAQRQEDDDVERFPGTEAP
ncbi:MAG: hypothetical protein KJ058_19095 [Thermoanaerobaculia bacterium]|nr:hypothetical protein [Thermoanaerobaculia bacterium]